VRERERERERETEMRLINLFKKVIIRIAQF
jgi:hypothetical protein